MQLFLTQLYICKGWKRTTAAALNAVPAPLPVGTERATD
ncbi:Uncharacterised protein [Serratia fonticola]|nr:Uncharacterised protein [Serratia fonticola]